jgi:hypothetical protein
MPHRFSMKGAPAGSLVELAGPPSPAILLTMSFSIASSTFGACRAAVSKRNGSARAALFSRCSRMSDGFDAHRQHQPQVPERSHSAQLAFAQQPFEVLVFVLPCGQGNLPSVGRFKRVLDELVPNGCQFGSFRLAWPRTAHRGALPARLAVVLRQPGRRPTS